VTDLGSAFDSPAAKRRYVRSLFATIADQYDFITRFLSYGQDQRWKRRVVREAAVARDERVIDLACGTGDIALQAAACGARVIGVDVTYRMLELAQIKASRGAADGLWPVPAFVAGDMMSLPLPTASADVVTTGYGLRNVPQLELAIDEIARVLKPGGRLVSLDFNRPANGVIRAAYLGYLTMVGSALGWLLHRDPDTYRYIPESIRRYPGASGVRDLLQARGFSNVRVVALLGGLMSLHVARRC
jgi:ubiquinone/menaquinone biosynthesis methyltransferase